MLIQFLNVDYGANKKAPRVYCRFYSYNPASCLRANKKAPSGACLLERVKGIEPSYSAWEAAALPLSYTRVFY